MTVKKKSQETVGSPQVGPEIGIKLLHQQIEKGLELIAKRPIDDNAYSTWSLVTKNILEKTFGMNSTNVKSIMNIGQLVIWPDWNGSQWDDYRFETIVSRLSNMEGLLELLKTEAQLTGFVEDVKVPSFELSRKVFIVHGHDDGVREAVARFLEKIGFQAIILHEQANQGRTVIEKVEVHGDVGFAIVLLTPDDTGCKVGNTPNPRPRQNVLLELGYFIGRLGRDKVCALITSDNMELPTDFAGVVWERFDRSGGWKTVLGRELQAAGFEIDWNNIMNS